MLCTELNSRHCQIWSSQVSPSANISLSLFYLLISISELRHFYRLFLISYLFFIMVQEVSKINTQLHFHYFFMKSNELFYIIFFVILNPLHSILTF